MRGEREQINKKVKFIAYQMVISSMVTNKAEEENKEPKGKLLF